MTGLNVLAQNTEFFVRFWLLCVALQYFVSMRRVGVMTRVTELFSPRRDSQHLDLCSAWSQVAHYSGDELRCLRLHYEFRCLEIYHAVLSLLLSVCTGHVFVFLWVPVCVRIYDCVYLSLCMSARVCVRMRIYMCLSEDDSVCVFASLQCLPVGLCVWVSVFQWVGLSLSLFISLYVCLYVSLPVRTSVCLYVCLSVWSFNHLTIHI